MEIKMEETIDDELNALKKSIIANCQSTNFDEYKTNLPKAYLDSRKTWRSYEDAKKNNMHDKAFKFLHLYVKLVLDHSLHRRQKDERYKKVSLETIERLKAVEPLLDNAMQGMRSQIILKHKMLLEQQKKNVTKGANSVSIVAPVSPPEPVLPEEKSSETQEKNRFDNIGGDVDSMGDGDFIPNAIAQPIKPSDSTPLYPDLNALDSKDISTSAVVPPNFSNANLPSVANIQFPPSAPAPNINMKKVAEKSESEDVEMLPTLPADRFAIKSVRGDGSCAFRSIAQGLHSGKLSQGEEDDISKRLRGTICKELFINRNEEMMKTGLTVEQLLMMDPTCKYNNFTSYVKGMGANDYAGEVELYILAKHLRRKISVYKKEGNKLHRLSTYGDPKGQISGPDINILWQQGFSEAGNHYDLLVPV